MVRYWAATMHQHPAPAHPSFLAGRFSGVLLSTLLSSTTLILASQVGCCMVPGVCVVYVMCVLHVLWCMVHGT